jgi:DNA-binding transcriptional ArsR family regulator
LRNYESGGLVEVYQALRSFKAEFFKALAHPLRISILDALRNGERGVGDLRDQLNVGTAIFRLLDVAAEIFNNHLVGVQGMLQMLNDPET